MCDAWIALDGRPADEDPVRTAHAAITLRRDSITAVRRLAGGELPPRQVGTSLQTIDRH
jgi:hypothetical protein